MAKDFEMTLIRDDKYGSFVDLNRSKTFSDYSSDENDDFEDIEIESKSCRCCCQGSLKMALFVMFIIAIICGAASGILYYLIKFDIISISRPTITTSTINLSTISITSATSLSPTFFNFTTYTNTNENSSFFEINSTEG
jgi:hypothetical protein